MINQTETRDRGLDEEKVNQVQNNCLKSQYFYLHLCRPLPNAISKYGTILTCPIFTECRKFAQQKEYQLYINTGFFQLLKPFYFLV